MSLGVKHQVTYLLTMSLGVKHQVTYLLTMSAQPPCVIACIDICVHIKNPKHWQPCHCLDTQKYVLHMLAGTGSAALAAYVALSW